MSDVLEPGRRLGPARGAVSRFAAPAARSGHDRVLDPAARQCVDGAFEPALGNAAS